MAETLFIRVRTDAIEWLLLDPSTGVMRLSDSGDWPALSAQLAQARWTGDTVLLVPTRQVLVTRATLPSRKQRVIQQALPFVVEEQVAAEVETMHFALGASLPDGSSLVATVERSLIAGWVERCREAGLQLVQLLPDAMLLPASEGGVELLIESDQVLLRHGADTVLALPAEAVAPLLRLIHAGGQPVQLHVRLPEGSDHGLLLAQWALELEAEPVTTRLDYPPFETLCRLWRGNELNLLQWEFRPRARTVQGRLTWSLVASLAALGFALHLLGLLAQGVYFDYLASRFAAQSMALYQAVFPGDKDVRDLRRRWASHLQPAGGETAEQDFYRLFAEAAGLLPAHGLTLDNVNYNDQRGDLVLQLRAGASEQLVDFAEALQANGLAADIGSINQESAQVKGSVRIAGGAAR